MPLATAPPAPAPVPGRAPAAPAESLSSLTGRLRGLGLTRSQLAIFVDCTKSNLTTGKASFGGRSLHDVSDPARPNPYETVIRLVSETMAPFDADGIIPIYGFGACMHACVLAQVSER